MRRVILIDVNLREVRAAHVTADEALTFIGAPTDRVGLGSTIESVALGAACAMLVRKNSLLAEGCGPLFTIFGVPFASNAVVYGEVDFQLTDCPLSPDEIRQILRFGD